MSYAVYTYLQGATPPCHIYSAVKDSGMQPFEPLDEAEAQALAAEISTQHPGTTTMVLPLEEYVTTANSFLVKVTGADGKVTYYGPQATKAGAEADAVSLKTGEDLKPGDTTEVIEVTAVELSGLPVEAMPE